MYRQQLCIYIDLPHDSTVEDQLLLLKHTGFEGFFTEFHGQIADYKRAADALGLIYQSIHAPYGNAKRMWGSDKEAQEGIDELCRCIRAAAEIGVPLVVMHVYIGFEPSEGPGEDGIRHYRTVVKEAERVGVKIAFENTEGEEYLDALLKAFADCENVGFCWDSGHELCYNRGRDLLALYGDRLFGTHLNDNLGISHYGGEITWRDDLHLFPFDGVIDWQDVACRLNRCGYDGMLTFELNIRSKPNRHDCDLYRKMTYPEYMATAYARACKVAALKLKRT